MSLRFFFYGTLLDADMRRLVLGAGNPDPVLEPAELPGHRAVLARGQRYPVLMKSTVANLPGALTEPVDAEAAERLAYYEGEGYRATRLTVRLGTGGTAEAAIFMPIQGLKPSAVVWDLARWQRLDKPAALRRIAHWMAAYRPSPAVLAARRRERTA
jgi:hypothetical protein